MLLRLLVADGAPAVTRRSGAPAFTRRSGAYAVIHNDFFTLIGHVLYSASESGNSRLLE